MSEAIGPNDRRLVLLVDYDVESRRRTRHMLEMRGMEVVQASNAMASLELIQRLPRSFRLVISDLDLPGIPGSVMIETLRIFRPDLPVLCMAAARSPAGSTGGKPCLTKPVQTLDLDTALEEVAGGWEPRVGSIEIPDTLAARVRARFAVARDLVEAALELSRGVGPEE